jgi:outer membrane protein assembly factor BamD
MISKKLLLILVLGAVGAGASGLGCSGKSSSGAVDYSVSAQKNYEKGLKALEDKEWVTAAKYFGFIKTRFPYSKYAVLAELRLADAEFGAESYIEAIDSYRLFIKFHPTHEMVANGYVSFRIGEGYFRQLSGNFWLFPPTSEKDQSSTEDAASELKSFLDKYPDSPYRARAKEIVASVGKRLADHEWYVARYYWDRGKPMATVIRLRRLLERYRGVGYDEEALWLLGRAYVAVAMPDRARGVWTELVDKYPRSKHAGDARSALTTIRSEPARKPAATAPAAPPPAATATTAPTNPDAAAPSAQPASPDAPPTPSPTPK